MVLPLQMRICIISIQLQHSCHGNVYHGTTVCRPSATSPWDCEDPCLMLFGYRIWPV